MQATRTPEETAAPVCGEAVPAAKLEVHLGCLRSTLLRSGQLFVEALLVPGLLFALVLHFVGLLPALGASLGWCYLVVGTRWIRGRRLSGTMLMCLGMMSGRAIVALATSSALLYLMQPVVGSVCTALMFVGSALFGRPITMRLARDFVSIPAHVLARRGVRRMFTEIAVLFGLSRLADAGMTLSFLHFGVSAGMLSRSLLSPLLTLCTIGACTIWGFRSLRREGVRVRLGNPTLA
ncbi:MAG TPA: hypothetical protein VFU36_10930 [Jatrophihabitans sp.]|nr:hypothetical protein [Jatrophihabitans sp.]